MCMGAWAHGRMGAWAHRRRAPLRMDNPPFWSYRQSPAVCASGFASSSDITSRSPKRPGCVATRRNASFSRTRTDATFTSSTLATMVLKPGCRRASAIDARAISVPSAGESLEHRVHELRVGVHRQYFQEPAETYEIAGRPVVSEPEAHAAPLEQVEAVANAVHRPLARKRCAVQQIAPDVIVLDQRMEVVDGLVGDRPIGQAPGPHV
jgi:hypothetical protein